MDFPPLDDNRWDRLLGAVIGQRPTVDDPASPLASPFPSPAPSSTSEAERDETSGATEEDTIDLDTYA